MIKNLFLTKLCVVITRIVALYTDSLAGHMSKERPL